MAGGLARRALPVLISGARQVASPLRAESVGACCLFIESVGVHQVGGLWSSNWAWKEAQGWAHSGA